ncbi:helix-turn-helix transcriptional regulator [Frigoribacterium sp. PhB160]
MAEAAGVTHTTLLSVLAGQVWPDLETIAKLERGLGVALWPRD